MGLLFRSSRVCIIATGASKGFGVSLCTVLAQNFREQISLENSAGEQLSTVDKLMFVLIARDGTRLQQIGNQLRSIDKRIDFHCVQCDLSEHDSIRSIEDCLLSNKFFEDKYGHYILLHNAGSTGDINHLCRTLSVEDWIQRNQYYRLNLYSVMELTGTFLRLTDKHCPDAVRHIINITSLLAIKPMKGLMDYSVGKAAREMYTQCLANELKEDGKARTRILNYSPGPLKTEMFEKLQKEGPLKETFQKMTPLDPYESAKKMVQILKQDKFDNAAHIDFFDERNVPKFN